MKTAIYVEDGVTQIVFTPATAFEREILARISREEVVQVRVAKGSFCRDPEGWLRFAGAGRDSEAQEQCLMLRVGGTADDDVSPSPVGGGLNGESFIGGVSLQVDGSSRHLFRPRDF